MSQQKASVLPVKYGKLEVRTRPIPTPQGKQVLAKVTAAGSECHLYEFTVWRSEHHYFSQSWGLEGWLQQGLLKDMY